MKRILVRVLLVATVALIPFVASGCCGLLDLTC